MIDKLKRVDPNASPEVLNVWLKSLPDEVHATSFAIIDKQRTLANLKQEFEVVQAKMMFEIASETEGNKPKYGNQTVRESVMTIRAVADKEAIDVKKRLNDQEDEVKQLEAHREYYAQQFRIIKDTIYYNFRAKELDEIKKIQANKTRDVMQQLGGREE